MEKSVRISWLLDFYGEFLTEKQRSLMDMHYNEDLSLGETAERAGITRQGVHDALKRSVEVLESCEDRLRLLDKYLAVKNSLDSLNEYLKDKTSLDAGETEMMKSKLLHAAAVWEGNNGL